MNPNNELGQFIPLHYHFNMLLDANRMGSFKAAIGQAVQPQSVVVELGGGTGVLSFFAAQKAKKVYYVEYNEELVAEARRILPQNENGDKVETIHADACAFTPPEPVDIVICEMLHVGLLREKQLAVIDAFKRNYQAAFEDKPLPIFIPFATMQALQPVHHPFLFEGYHATIPMFNDPYAEAPDITAFGDPVVYHQLLYDQPYGTNIEWSGHIPITAAGTVNALRFITKSLLFVDPATQSITDWYNQYLIYPLGREIEVSPGNALEISFGYKAGAPLSALKPEVTLR